MPSSYLLSNQQIVLAHAPVDYAGGAVTGDRVSMVNYRRCAVCVATDIGTAGEDIIITLQEHTAATSGTSQNLAVITKYWTKTGGTAINAVGTWTETTQTAAATIDTADTDGAENEQLLVFEVTADQLSSGFDFISVNIDDQTTAGLLGLAWYVLTDPRHIDDPANMISAIA